MAACGTLMSSTKKNNKLVWVGPMPSPTDDMVDGNDPLFEAIWKVIKKWDVNVPEYYTGYCGANGSHVMLIYDEIKKALEEIIDNE